MSDVFVSYKREDEARVAQLVSALEAQGLAVWWDRALPGAQDWRTQLETQLDAARCVVVAWSHACTGPQGCFVRDEAERGQRRGILVPVLLDPVQPPLDSGEPSAVDLTGWRGSPHDEAFLKLLAAVRARVGGPGAPQPTGPMERNPWVALIRRITRHKVAGALIAALVALAGAFADNTLNLQDRICESADVLSDTCGALGLGSRPSREERLAWQARPRGDCQALRAHLQHFPDGAFRLNANALLGARRVTTVEQWLPVTRKLPLVVMRDAPPAPNQPAARTAALQRGREQGELLCEEFPATGLMRLEQAEPRPVKWNCLGERGGTVCGFEGFVACELQQQSVAEQEHCDES